VKFNIRAHIIAKSIRNKLNKKKIPVESVIKQIVLSVFLINKNMLMSKTRKPEIVLVRQTGMLLFCMAKCTLSKSASFFGKDHATALHAIKKKCFPILETKTPRDEYDNIVCAIKTFHILLPEYSLSNLPREWDNPDARIHKPFTWNRNQQHTVSSLQRQ